MDKKTQDLITYLQSASTGNDPSLDKQLKSYAGLTKKAAALNLANPQGTQQKGFLSGVLPFLMRPQSAVLGGIVGINTGESGKNILNALSGRQTFTGSQVLGPVAENASIADRFKHAVLGLGIDVVTDPLTYLTMGNGGTMRGAKATAAVEAQTIRAANKVLKPVSKPVEVSKETVG